jgi:hypothetical protein
MAGTGLLENILPEFFEIDFANPGEELSMGLFEQTLKVLEGVHPKLSLRLTALLYKLDRSGQGVSNGKGLQHKRYPGQDSERAGRVMNRLNFSRKIRDRVTHLIAHCRFDYRPSWTDGDVRRFIRRVGPEHLEELMSLWRSEISVYDDGGIRGRYLNELADRIRSSEKAPAPLQSNGLKVDGRTVMDIMGIPPGEAVGRILGELLERVTDQPELNREESLRQILYEMKELSGGQG